VKNDPTWARWNKLLQAQAALNDRLGGIGQAFVGLNQIVQQQTRLIQFLLKKVNVTDEEIKAALSPTARPDSEISPVRPEGSSAQPVGGSSESGLSGAIGENGDRQGSPAATESE
jgi:hypothetical protein